MGKVSEMRGQMLEFFRDNGVAVNTNPIKDYKSVSQDICKNIEDVIGFIPITKSISESFKDFKTNYNPYLIGYDLGNRPSFSVRALGRINENNQVTDIRPLEIGMVGHPGSGLIDLKSLTGFKEGELTNIIGNPNSGAGVGLISGIPIKEWCKDHSYHDMYPEIMYDGALIRDTDNLDRSAFDTLKKRYTELIGNMEDFDFASLYPKYVYGGIRKYKHIPYRRQRIWVSFNAAILSAIEDFQILNYSHGKKDYNRRTYDKYNYRKRVANRMVLYYRQHMLGKKSVYKMNKKRKKKVK
jgi:hypothetical protein